MEYKRQAEKLHQSYGMVDAHMDLATEIFNRNQMGESHVIETHYLSQWRKAGIKFIVSSIFIENQHLPELAIRMALRQINGLKKEIEMCSDELVLVLNQKHLDEVLSSEKIGIIISFEGLEPIMNDVDLLNSFYDLGVRGAGLVWSRRNYVAEGSYFGDVNKGLKSGLSPFGIDVVSKMEKLGMFIDVSHLNDDGVEDVFEYTNSPILASHSNCRAINGIKRNLTDAQIKQIGQSGGVIGINNIRPIVMEGVGVDYIEVMCNHLDHIVEIAGIDSVGFGFDLCKGIEMTSLRYGNQELEIVDALNSHSGAIKITEKLLERGYREEDCKKILRDNMLRFFRCFLK